MRGRGEMQMKIGQNFSNLLLTMGALALVTSCTEAPRESLGGGTGGTTDASTGGSNADAQMSSADTGLPPGADSGVTGNDSGSTPQPDSGSTGVADSGTLPPATGAFVGYTLFSALGERTTELIDINNQVVHSWSHPCSPASIPYLLDDGSILRPCQVANPPLRGGATGGRIQRIAWDGTVMWDYLYSNSEHQQHHDIEPLPNGNIILIAWEVKTTAEAQAMGRQSVQSNGMWPLEIIEIQPQGMTGGTVVWEWHSWDHLIQDVDPNKPNYGVVADHPELIDINLASVRRGDWIHANGIDYNPNRDEIVFSSHSLDEFYIIDHSTTTQEAAGHTGGNSGKGGDILYRWGNPENYGAGTSSDQHFFVLHGVNWIDDGLPGAGNILVFNNGDRQGSANDNSSVNELVMPIDSTGAYILEASGRYGPSAPLWTYEDPGNFYSNHLAGAYRLPNGNTIISEATSGHLFEVTADKQRVWSFRYTVGRAEIARAQRYAPSHPGLSRL